MTDDYHPMHKNTTFPIKIGNIAFGESPSVVQPYAQPNPTSVNWSRTNSVKVHEIPYPAWKTMRTSKRSLYKLDVTVKTVRKETALLLLIMCENVGPVWVETFLGKKWMYITDFTPSQSEGNDDENIDWQLTLQEVND